MSAFAVAIGGKADMPLLLTQGGHGSVATMCPFSFLAGSYSLLCTITIAA